MPSDGAVRYVPSDAHSAPMHLLFVSVGSMGDVYPMVEVAAEWVRRGHAAGFVTLDRFRGRVEAAGVEFHGVEVPSYDLQPDALARVRRGGARRIVTDVVGPTLVAAYAGLERLVEAVRPDGMVVHDLAAAAPILAEARGLRWAAVVLQPASFLSGHDPPVSPEIRGSRLFHRLGPRVARLGLRVAGIDAVPEPVRRLRRDLGLPGPARSVLRAKGDADLALALFPSLLGAPQPDWPDPTVLCGLPRPGGEGGLPPDVAAFLDDGPRPAVFALGDSASWGGRPFFEASVEAARGAGLRAVLVTGSDEARGDVAVAGPDVLAAGYVPYGPLFARSRVAVHAGGMGTIGLALRAGVPQLAVPRIFDQFDNAARVERAGLGAVVPWSRYEAGRAAGLLRELIGRADVEAAVRSAGAAVAAEDGAAVACDALESMVRSRVTSPPPPC